MRPLRSTSSRKFASVSSVVRKVIVLQDVREAKRKSLNSITVAKAVLGEETLRVFVSKRKATFAEEETRGIAAEIEEVGDERAFILFPRPGVYRSSTLLQRTQTLQGCS